MIRQLHLPLPQTEAMRLEDFLLSAVNDEAVTCLIRKTPEAWSSHLCVLWGPEGSGKTHLLSIWKEKNNGKQIELGSSALSDIIAGMSPARAFVIDDADHVAGDPKLEEWLQHFYNATKAASLPVLIAARKPPALWELGLKDIETRLKSCMTVHLEEPDDDLIRGLFLKLFADRQLLVETGVIEYLAQRVDRTASAVRQTVALLDEASLEAGRKISIPFAQKVLVQEEQNND